MYFAHCVNAVRSAVMLRILSSNYYDGWWWTLVPVLQGISWIETITPRALSGRLNFRLHRNPFRFTQRYILAHYRSRCMKRFVWWTLLQILAREYKNARE